MTVRRMATGLLGILLLSTCPVEGKAQGSASNPGPWREAELVDGVAAVVGDYPVLRSQVEEQFTLLAPRLQIDPNDSSQANQLRREILDKLIHERLLKVEAEGLGIEVDQKQVDAGVEEEIQANRDRLGDEGFASQLLAEGLTEDELRSDYATKLHEEFLTRQLLQREVYAKVTVTDTQVLRHFEENRDKIGKRPRSLRVLNLFVRTTPDSLIENTYRERAGEVRTEILGGLSFEEAAKRYSDDESTADKGGLLGRFAPGDLGDPNFEGAAFTLPIGEVSAPVRTNLGYHLIQVDDRDPEGAWTQVRHILIGITPSRSDKQRTRMKVEKIREEIVSNAIDFSTAVARYSQNEPTRQNGGDIGWLPIDGFMGETRAVVESLRVGDVSRIAQVEGGFHIFKLIGEQAETDYVFDEIKDELRNIVEMEERQKRLDEYLAELRAKTFVEIRPIQ